MAALTSRIAAATLNSKESIELWQDELTALGEDQEVWMDLVKSYIFKSLTQVSLAWQVLLFDEGLQGDCKVLERLQLYLERVHTRGWESSARHWIAPTLPRSRHRLGVVTFKLVETELDRAYALSIPCVVPLSP